MKALINDPKEMEVYELSDKEFKVILFTKSSKVQEHRDRQLNKLEKQYMNKMRSLTKENHKKN